MIQTEIGSILALNTKIPVELFSFRLEISGSEKKSP